MLTQGSVLSGHGTRAYTGPFGADSCGMVTLNEPRFQPDQYFSTKGTTSAGFTSPAMISVVYSGRYQRSKKDFEYSNWLGMSSMSRINPMVVCLYVCAVKACSR